MNDRAARNPALTLDTKMGSQVVFAERPQEYSRGPSVCRLAS